MMSATQSPLRWASAVAALICLLFVAKQSTADELPTKSRGILKIDAERISYYTDQQMIEARGNVRLALSNGVTISGDACVLNLSLQRFIVAGHVKLDTPQALYSGAAVADYLPFHRIYFIPLNDIPDRWTFLNENFAAPEKGRVMPGDAFFLPDFSGLHPFISGRHATIDPANYVKFSPATFVFLEGSLRTPPLPAYVRNFSDNPNFAVNSLSGATYDIPFGFAGSSDSLETLHFRYDQLHKTYGSFEHHSVFGQYGYAVFSLNPATQPFKQWNLLSYDGSARGALALNAQLFTYQYGLSQPLSSNAFVDLQYTRALTGSAARLEVTQSWDSLLAPNALGYYGNPSHPIVANHPIVAGINWIGFDKSWAKTGLTYRLTSGLSETHDVFGVGFTGKENIGTSYLSGLIYTPVYPAPLNTGVNASYEAQRTWLTSPGRLDLQTVTISDSKRVSNRLALTASYLWQTSEVSNLAAVFASPSASTGLVPQPSSPNGLPLIGGVVAQYPNVRDNVFVVSSAWAPSPNFQLTVVGQDNHYTPAQQPFGSGPPHYQVLGDVRTRLSKTFFIDIGRVYYFNWGNQRWSPLFSLQLSSQ